MGRTRKLVRRQPNGQPYRPPERVSAETVFARQRDLKSDGVDPSEWNNALAGFSLGRLRLRGQANHDDPGGISESQFNAGDAWARIVHRHGQIMGYEVRRNVQSPGFTMVGGTPCIPEESEEEIAHIRDRFTLCYNALAKVSRAHYRDTRIMLITWAVCMDNRPIEKLSKADHGDLRLGLNALAKVLG